MTDTRTVFIIQQKIDNGWEDWSGEYTSDTAAIERWNGLSVKAREIGRVVVREYLIKDTVIFPAREMEPRTWKKERVVEAGVYAWVYTNLEEVQAMRRVVEDPSFREEGPHVIGEIECHLQDRFTPHNVLTVKRALEDGKIDADTGAGLLCLTEVDMGTLLLYWGIEV